jgi:ATP-dependent helicase HrpB
MTALPVEEALPALRAALAAPGAAAVLQAPPGAGKSTRLPLALLDELWVAAGRILMLEPRRLAARAVAARMAATLGEPVGRTVGYRIRDEVRVGAATRIEVITEGILTRLLQDDASLPGVTLLIFDEFHERSLHADLGLALALEARATLREDLRLLVMSATLDGARVAALLGGAPLISSEGRLYPVDTVWLGRPPREARLEDAMASACRRALSETAGDVLAFLPGEAEIRRVAERLAPGAAAGQALRIHPLYGNLPAAEQDAALAPAPPGARKLVLATPIAQTSLTIEGVRAVVDSGLARVPRFDPGIGMTRLVTLPISQAAAEQRAGRAGRVAAGVCYRLWSREEHPRLSAFDTPEIMQADLAPLALELAVWGTADPAALPFLDRPPAAAHAQARALLQQLDALDAAGRITAHGRALARLPLHPRLAQMCVRGAVLGAARLACELAALLEERDVLRGPPAQRETDIELRLALLRGRQTLAEGDRGTLERVRQSARRLLERLGPGQPANGGNIGPGALLALAYPERIAQRRSAPAPEQRDAGHARYLMANGKGAYFAQPDALARSEYLVLAQLDGTAREARIFQAAALAPDDIEDLFAARVETRRSVRWDARERAVLARRQRTYGALLLEDALDPQADPGAVRAALLDGIRELGMDGLPWTETARRWQARVALLAAAQPEGGWPEVSDAALLHGLEHWLAPWLDGMSRAAHLARLDLMAALQTLLDHRQQRTLDELAPTHLVVPTGSRLALDYTAAGPVLAVRLQEMFGCADTPRIVGGRVPVTLHLLSPAQRPVQVTQDLAGFWRGSYADVKKDMKGRYPRHHWPDDPWQAAPTRRAKPRGT